MIPAPHTRASLIPKISLFFLTLCLFACKPANKAASIAPADEEILVETSEPIEPQATGPELGSTPATTLYRGTKVVFYNVRNYLRMDRRVRGRYVKDAPKPEYEIDALIKVIASAKPQILALCEMGTRAELDDLARRLESAGMAFPHREWIQASDPHRHLALLSAFPITSRDSLTELDYPINQTRLPMSRGILNVTLDIHGAPLELMIAHLKSKREIKDFDQAEMRRQEAGLLRKLMEDRLKSNPDARFAVLGDFNDTRRAPAIETLRGPFNTPLFCDSLPLEAKNGTRWTQFWSYQDVYSRFDYIFVSPGLMPLVNLSRSHIIDHPEWEKASDHRALLMTFN